MLPAQFPRRARGGEEGVVRHDWGPYVNSNSLTATRRTFLQVGASRLDQECPQGSACPSHDTRFHPEIAGNRFPISRRSRTLELNLTDGKDRISHCTAKKTDGNIDLH